VNYPYHIPQTNKITSVQSELIVTAAEPWWHFCTAAVCLYGNCT